MLRHAFKEWAVICRALAEGRQALILRKGGIAEPGGDFRPERARFWLYPTYVHQQAGGVKPEAADLLAAAERDRPAAGTVRLTHFAELTGAFHVTSLAGAVVLDDFHLWTPETVRSRFEYRTPGLFVLPVRVFRAASAHELPETPEYAGCKTWVDLGRDLPTDPAEPVLSDAAFDAVVRSVERRLNPVAQV
jgi:hypothetical protein